MCGVTGLVYDVIDIDPRNGGRNSLDKLDDALGDNGPEIAWRVRTPSAGLHLYIASLGIGSHNGFLPGIDLKGGNPDGSGRGFVFLPPTVRPSKLTDQPAAYEPTTEIEPPGEACTALAEWIEQHLEAKAAPSGDRAGGFRREEASALRAACLGAEAGEQRETLLRYVHELERRGYDRDDIVSLVYDLTIEMPSYDPDRPWKRDDIRGLLHKRGVVIADAGPEELAGLDEVQPLSAGLIRWASGLTRQQVSWLMKGWLAFREMTLLDGEKGQGKSFVTDDWTARATRGLPFPGMEEASCGPISVIVFTDEGHMESVTGPRLEAAGADMSRVAFPAIKVPKRGSKEFDAWNLALPDGAPLIGKMIREAGAQFAIFDPITDFMGEEINTHNDASVRRALGPLCAELARADCCGLAIRHMNKDTSKEAKYRGGGTTAFQNRARIHVVTGYMPDDAPGQFGLAMVDTNLTRKEERILAYDIVDSDIPMDDEGHMIGKVDWLGWTEDVDANALTRREPMRRGPSPTAQPIIAEILNELFSERDTWPAKRIQEVLAEGGYRDAKTINKAAESLGIRKFPLRRRGAAGVRGWYWTTRKDRVSELDEPVPARS
jgi:AAA domain/Bifunctional DNA primase/polymerase, N-terminal